MTTETTQRAYFFKDIIIKKIRHTIQKKLNHAGLNITVEQWVLIDHIKDKEGLSQIELAEVGHSVTRILNLLVSKGLVERRMLENDRRKIGIHLTEAGRSKHYDAYQIVAEVRQLEWVCLFCGAHRAFVRIMGSIYNEIDRFGNIIVS